MDALNDTATRLSRELKTAEQDLHHTARAAPFVENEEDGDEEMVYLQTQVGCMDGWIASVYADIHMVSACERIWCAVSKNMA